MRIAYLYNEILPKKKAHDVFIFQECAAFADLGWEVTLLCGKGSLDHAYLYKHYETTTPIHIERLPIVRKNNFLNLSWNLPFFWSCQRFIQKKKPDVVFLSVRKQGEYHLKRKVAGVRYLYEVHELAWYPGDAVTTAVEREREMLSRADFITVTTQALRDILLSAPYNLTVPVEVIPLAVRKFPLPLRFYEEHLTLMYVGQLYAGQGLPLLLKALSKTEGLRLQIVGGKPKEIETLQQLAQSLNLEQRVDFLGFCPPPALPSLVQQAHVCIAPFEAIGRMPYVAHTKLFEYAEWQRPIIAPKLPIVEEHFSEGRGALLFDPDNVEDLTQCLKRIQTREVWEKLAKEIVVHQGAFSWESRARAYQEFLS